MPYDQKARLSIEPVADDPGALLTITWPSLWQTIIGHFVTHNSLAPTDITSERDSIARLDRSFATTGTN